MHRTGVRQLARRRPFGARAGPVPRPAGTLAQPGAPRVRSLWATVRGTNKGKAAPTSGRGPSSARPLVSRQRGTTAGTTPRDQTATYRVNLSGRRRRRYRRCRGAHPCRGHPHEPVRRMPTLADAPRSQQYTTACRTTGWIVAVGDRNPGRTGPPAGTGASVTQTTARRGGAARRGRRPDPSARVRPSRVHIGLDGHAQWPGSAPRRPGSRSTSSAPPSGARPAHTAPPWRRATCRTMASPSPDPGMVREVSAR